MAPNETSSLIPVQFSLKPVSKCCSSAWKFGDEVQFSGGDCHRMKVVKYIIHLFFLWYEKVLITVELQWFEHLWNHEVIFETAVLRAEEC